MNIYKQKLSVTDQVKRLEDKGISFNVFCKERAEDYLKSNNYYYKLTSFRKNFRKHPDGVNKGKYVNLDFAYLCCRESKDLTLYIKHIIDIFLI